MTIQRSSSNQNTRCTQGETAGYFGLTVLIVARMENCSLVRHRDREFIVDTADLQKCVRSERAAA